jgi:DNA-binding response OmpR family regulator
MLVVDDNPMCRSMVARILHDEGFDVLEARDGFQGICMLSGGGHHIRFLVVDTEMPGVHGWEVIRFARMKAPKMRVLRLGRPDDVVPAPQYEVFRALPALEKPFTSALLLMSVRRQLRLPANAKRRSRAGHPVPGGDR